MGKPSSQTILLVSVVCMIMTLPGCRSRQSKQKLKLASYLMPVQVRSQIAEMPEAEEIGRWAENRLKLAKRLMIGRAEGAAAYHLELSVVAGATGGGQALCAVHGTGQAKRQPAAGTLQAEVIAPIDPNDVDGGARRCVKSAVMHAIADLDEEAELLHGPPLELVAFLNTKNEPRRLMVAIDCAARRGLHEAVPALVKLLRSTDERVSDRAVGALVAIGDRRAISALTRLSKFEDTEKLAKLLDAIGTLGGEEARGFLEFVAGGHPDKDIRNIASAALSRLRAASKTATHR